jgi:hypothetical protein
VVGRFGRTRDLRPGGLGDLGAQPDLDGPFDLIVCADVLGYVTPTEARRGLAAVADRLGGVLFADVYVRGEAIDGDVADYRRRPAATVQSWFEGAGLHRVGPHCWVGDRLRPSLVAFER